ncbi:tetratricopeptide repeat protein [Fundidesulfovibrio terrae]|uniref:tetratricopeptide repeat protein n=1 Tax=Fundidesulfovibrio terrae TaxID=2922866 RepID=UPI001FAEF536|nr:tetratricopeptide repeat protein [Fundidesulfovibrio terrae]
MKRSTYLACLTVVSVLWVLAGPTIAASAKTGSAPSATREITGSSGCHSCHKKFHGLWSTSFHGLAMRPYSDSFAKADLTPQEADIVIGQSRFRAETGAGQGWVKEATGKDEKQYRITHVLGGKNVFYFLTPMDKGRLQTLPVAYDVRKREWFDMAASGVRHFPNETSPAIGWKDWPYTFNTGCYGCHVSQLSTNYDPKSDTYRTTWVEPGINCETCHGPGLEHVRACEAAPKGKPPKDLKIIRGGQDFTNEQKNALCATCHAKTVPLTTGFTPGDRYFDHYDLIGYESPDFYPDGRDLGENYTFTSWSRSPCARSGKLECMHCHTSSGRYKFKDEAKANDACLPCHALRVADAPAHTRHPAGSAGNRCVSCHMPMTEFARMRRSDHSMLPPTPAATMAFKSPNACNICHADKDADWADKAVRSWHARDHQAPVLALAGLVDAARRRDWTSLQAMLEYIGMENPDEIYAASLVRLLRSCPDQRKWDAIAQATKSSSPLVRAAAAEALSDVPSRQALDALIRSASDDFRLVRVRAAAALSGVPRKAIAPADHPAVDKATGEYLASLTARPDLWTSQYNMGNYYLGQGDLKQAAASFEAASRFDPASIPPLVNASIAYSRQGDASKAEKALQAALRLDPNDAPANFNLGLLKAEQKDSAAAERHLRTALQHNPDMAEAAFNLGILLAGNRLGEALAYSRKAAELRPDIPKYAYTYAFFLDRSGDWNSAAQVLRQVVDRFPGYRDAADLLGVIQKRIPSK